MTDTPRIQIADIEVPERRLRRLRPEIVDEIADSMSKIGLLLQPILVSPKGGGGYILLAGRHRYEAAGKLKWERIGATIAEEMDADAMQLAEIDENLARADLTPAEQAEHLAKRKEIHERVYPETKQGGAPGKAGGGKKAKTAKLATFAKEAANKTGVAERTVRRAVQRAKAIPDISQLAGTSLDQGDELDAMAKLNPADQQKLIERAKAGEKVSAKHELKKVKRAAKERSLAEATVKASESLGTQLYACILADPPWRFEPYSRDTGMDRAADNHYPTQTLSEIMAVPVPAAKDAALFLWATAPMLPEALRVMQAWGFEYRTHFVWVKDKIGTGYWGRNRHELLLIGVKGEVPCPAPGTQWESVIEAPVGRHSEKPEKVHELIESYFPSLPKIELFARARREGWAVWGNEALRAASVKAGHA